MKKKIGLMLLFLLVCVFMLNTNVYAVGEIRCSALGDAVIDASIVDTVHLIILVIQIAVPVILVIFGMLDLVKGVMSQKEDEIKKGQQVLVKRIIAAALVFFVIAIVKLVISLVAGDSKDDLLACANCFIQGSNSENCG